MVLPELLGGVLAGHALEDLGAARVLVEEVCRIARLASFSGLLGSLRRQPLFAPLPFPLLIAFAPRAHRERREKGSREEEEEERGEPSPSLRQGKGAQNVGRETYR